jgi:hypothetical protein
MPLYEYDAPLKVHAGCGGAVKRQMTAPTFQFKGSGWYETDYAKKGRSNGGSHARKDDSKDTGQAGEGKESAKETAPKAKESPSKSSASSSSEGSTSAGRSSAPPASSDKS